MKMPSAHRVETRSKKVFGRPVARVEVRCIACPRALTVQEIAAKHEKCGVCRGERAGAHQGSHMTINAEKLAKAAKRQPTPPAESWWIGLSNAEFAAEVKRRYPLA